ncbi:PEP-CTERM sorting domain-containing protein [Aquisphaera insulae]|uniref:PEP-CTERM sorting domain-containing protein n=1 Tax=Aquisphaera insulae TaxID=2712864 RepID=UPI0013EE0CC4|nr:PEP-CTERM sorting domain-containing protein [Aquisphaera insulae]
MLVLGLGAGTAKAAGLKVIPAPIKQQGDPQNLYIVDLGLEPLTGAWLGDNVTFKALPGVDYSTIWQTPTGPSSPTKSWATDISNVTAGDIPNYSPPTPIPFGDITFTYADFTVPEYNNLSSISDRPLGRFTVITADLFPFLPPGYSFEVDWVANLHVLENGVWKAETFTGRVTFSIVPEPASIVMLGVAAAGLPALLYANRRRRAA